MPHWNITLVVIKQEPEEGADGTKVHAGMVCNPGPAFSYQNLPGAQMPTFLESGRQFHLIPLLTDMGIQELTRKFVDEFSAHRGNNDGIYDVAAFFSVESEQLAKLLIDLTTNTSKYCGAPKPSEPTPA